MQPGSVGRVARAIDLVTAGNQGDEFTAAARGPRTWLAYGVAVRRFLKWAAAEGHQPLPASTASIKAFLIHLAHAGLRASTIDTYRSGIRCWHRQAGFNIDLAPTYDLCKGIRRKAPRPHKAKELMAAQLQDIVAHLDPQKLSDVRDGALLTLMFCGALRGAEAVALDWERPGPRSRDALTRANEGYLSIAERGIEVILTSSKTSPGRPVPVPISAKAWPRAFECMSRWTALAELAPGQPIFRPLTKGGRILNLRLTSGALTPIVRQHVWKHLRRAGLTEMQAHVEALAYSSHSLRAGLLSTLADGGTDEWKIRERSRHKSADVAAGYIRLQSAWDTDWGVKL